MEYEEIDMRELFFILKKRWVIILVFIILVEAAIGIVSYFVLDKQYEACTTIIVKSSAHHETGELKYNDMMMYQNLVKTFSEIAKSRMMTEKVIKDTNLNISVETLQNKISVAYIRGTQMMTIKSIDTDPEAAAYIANKLADILKAQVAEIMQVEYVEIIDPAVVPLSPVKPRPKHNMIIALALALIIGVVLAFLLEYMDNTVKTPEDVEKLLKLPLLAVIPDMEMSISD